MRKWISILAVLPILVAIPALATSPGNNSITGPITGNAATGSNDQQTYIGPVTNTNTATGGAGGNATATGGTGGNASVYNSGNSMNFNSNHNENSNRNTNTATGGNASAGASSNATNTTNLTNNNNNTFNPTSTNIQGQNQGQHQGQHQGQQQSVNNSQTISPTQTNSQTLIQNVAAPAPGMGRQFAPNLEMPGPINTQRHEGTGKGWTVLPKELYDAAGIPIRFSMEDAKSLIVGSVKSTVRATKSGAVKFDYCYRMGSLPKDAEMVGRIYLRTKQPVLFGEPGVTDDLIGTAAKLTMENGRNAFVILAQDVMTSPNSTTVGLGLAYTQSQLAGSEKENGMTGGGGTGIAYSRGGRTFDDSLIVVFFVTKEGRAQIASQVKKADMSVNKTVLAKEEVKADPFRCIATRNYTPPADCK
jgi:hypothetical protein